jgi:2-oxoglutarate ferredoxin oxidoreductase subunit beta
MKLQAVTIGQNGVTEKDLLVHDAREPETAIHVMLAAMRGELPVALGVIRDVSADTYEAQLEQQIETVRSNAKILNINDLLNSGETWTVE